MLSGFRGSSSEGHYLVLTSDQSYDDFCSHLNRVETLGGREAEAYEHFTDNKLRGFSTCYIVEGSADQLDNAIVELSVEVVSRERAFKLHADMMSQNENDESEFSSRRGDQRTLREIAGLTEDDPWEVKGIMNWDKKPDKRTDITGESFVGADEGKVEVSKIDGRTEGGSIIIDSATVFKDFSPSSFGKINHPRDFDFAIVSDPETLMVFFGKADAEQDQLPKDTENRLPVCFLPSPFGYYTVGSMSVEETRASLIYLGFRESPQYSDEVAKRYDVIRFDQPADLSVVRHDIVEGIVRGDRANVLFAVYVDEFVPEEEGGLTVHFSSKEFWENNHCIPDHHMADELARLGLDDEMFDEIAENAFVPLYYSADETIMMLQHFGFTYAPELLGDETEIVYEITGEAWRLQEMVDLFGIEVKIENRTILERDPAIAARLTHLLGSQHVTPEPPPYRIDVLVGLPFRKFYRLDVNGITMKTAMAVFAEAGIDPEAAFLYRDANPDGTIWFACAIERLAEKHRAILLENFPSGVVTAVYAANTHGERLVEEGIVVIDPNAAKKIPIRPWSRRDEFMALDDKARAKIISEIRAGEIYFAGYDKPGGSTVYFVPASYFNEHDEMFPEDIEPYMGNLLRGLTKIDTNTYSSTREYLQLLNALSDRGFRENILFQMWLNLNG